MAKVRTRTGTPYGVQPTKQQNLINKADRLGLQGLQNMQGSSLNIFDTVLVTQNTSGRQQLQFFIQTSNKARNFSNFQNGTLNAGESLYIQRINFVVCTLSGTDLTSPATSITDIKSISQLDTVDAAFTQPGSIKTGMLSISIANQTVLKDYNIIETSPEWNPQTTGISVAAVDHAASGTTVTTKGPYGYAGIQMEAPFLLPPNQNLEIDLEIGPTGTVTGNVAIMCIVGRFGSIFASKTTL